VPASGAVVLIATCSELLQGMNDGLVSSHALMVLMKQTNNNIDPDWKQPLLVTVIGPNWKILVAGK
jgi:hypothetical protein